MIKYGIYLNASLCILNTNMETHNMPIIWNMAMALALVKKEAG